jgi:UrcA family protein
MKKTTKTTLSAFVLGTVVALPMAASAQSVDEFAIDVILTELEDERSHEAFETRLEREARSYCRVNYQGSDLRGLRTCQTAVVAAVEDALYDNQGDLQMAYGAPNL